MYSYTTGLLVLTCFRSFSPKAPLGRALVHLCAAEINAAGKNIGIECGVGKPRKEVDLNFYGNCNSMKSC